MSELRFQVSGSQAHEVAARMGALIEGNFGHRPVTQTTADVVTFAMPASLFAGPHRVLQDKLAALIGVAIWEVRNGVRVVVRAGDDKGAGQRLDELPVATLIELGRK